MSTDLVATVILTGRRPDLLTRTLTSLNLHHPEVLSETHVILLINGGDDATRTAVEPWETAVDDLLVTPDLLPIPEASQLLVRTAYETGLPYLFRLEDDWESTGRSPGWIGQAVWILEDEWEAAQVRLRDDRETVLARHMTRGHDLVWHDRDGYRYSPDAHATHNPSLWRMEVAALAYPADDERGMQERVRSHGWTASAQLVPGEFRHLGDGDLSLKRAVRRGRVR
jgi:hypothetical protein